MPDSTDPTDPAQLNDPTRHQSEAPADPAGATAALAIARADAALVALGALFELLQGDRQLLSLFDARAASAGSALQADTQNPAVLREYASQIAVLRDRLTRVSGPNPMDVGPTEATWITAVDPPGADRG